MNKIRYRSCVHADMLTSGIVAGQHRLRRVSDRSDGQWAGTRYRDPLRRPDRGLSEGTSPVDHITFDHY